MANECIWAYGNQITLEGNGASQAANNFVAASNQSNSTNHGDFPLGDFALECAFGATIGNGTTVNLYRCDQGIIGSNNAVAPSALNPRLFVGSFGVPDTQAANSVIDIPLDSVPLGKTAAWYIENKAGQTLSATWVLKMTPKTYKPGA
jgi:hypothetical protein